MTRAYVWTRTHPLAAALVLAAVLVGAFVLLLIGAGVAEASHQRMNGGTGPLCPHCASWNVICRIGNWIDRCAPRRW